MSIGCPIATKYGNGYKPETKNQSETKSAIYGILRRMKPPCFFNSLHFRQRIPSWETHDEQTCLEHTLHERLPNREPQIWQFINS
jgi:hypothetical protein